MNEKDRNLLKNLFQSPGWRVLETVANIMVEEYRSEIKIKDSEWETLKATLLSEGMERGIKNFLQRLLNEAQKQND